MRDVQLDSYDVEGMAEHQRRRHARLGSAAPGFDGVGFLQAIKLGLSLSNISGRSSRSEYWYFVLFCGLANIASVVLFTGILEISYIDSLIGLILNILQTIILVRRLHDVDRSGRWVLISLTIIGIVPLFIWSIRKGDPGPNRFDDPQRTVVNTREEVDRRSGAIEQIERLHRLKVDGIITEQEFEVMKKRAI